jgi:UDP-N-acetylglucosamine--dolichyl-phosphate N-acetylglucosaminephosphotransferase
LFPRVPDQHKANKPLVLNGLGVFYVLASVVYLFFMFYYNVVNFSNGGFPDQGLVWSAPLSAPLILAVCILFGGFLGMLDDWVDLRWRYKAFLPLIAVIPLVSFAFASPGLRTSMTIPFLGSIDFGIYYYLVVLPLLVTIITNTVNQLGGLNGLETVCPAVVLLGLMVMAGGDAVYLYVPLVAWLVLAVLNFRGKIFVGNTGSFAIGMTVASFAVISNLKLNLVVSVLPYIFNSSLILLTFFFTRKKASVGFDGNKLVSDHRRSLITLLTYRRPLTERQVVLLISLLVAATTLLAVVMEQLFLPK